ncbi:arylsulfatase [Dyadobacter sp. LJ53]|uniref:arylsulfatase n=1 Tax=Dyadobacter chenwenxiniae TaxID=2906456 RepID=UPI001F3590D8|nr:arylsulfatase [Dyadobacter chenwenxiniae]MCF0052599.1 arylsulfatase [Dyadobacter chenwenxiniae]
MMSTLRFRFLQLLLLLLSVTSVRAQDKSQHPNIIIVLADDLGFSDLGCFGSEISTPNLDRLAREGIKLTSFYNSGRCCPSRAALLTGLYPHQAGIGDMVQDKGSPAYQGYLSENSATIAQLLKTKDYNTIISGKWHVGLVPSALAHNRGFDKSFTMLNNGSSYFNSEPIYNDGRTVNFLLNGQKIERQDTSRYLTQAITDFAVKSLDEVKSSKNPFFLYVAYTAPHWPIQAPPGDIAKYKGKYMEGWDALRKQRFERQKQFGIIDKQWPLSSRYEGASDWEKLTSLEKDLWDTRMAIYAAMIDRMDRGVGEILTKLKDIQKDKNTLVIFVSDNGGSGDTVKDWNYVTQKNGTPGSVNAIDSYYPEWGNASNTPFRLFKKNTHEGGIASPFIAWFPGQIAAGTSSSQIGHLIDLLPTCLEWAGLQYPRNLAGKELTALPGTSLKSTLTADQNKNKRSGTVNRTLFWEHEGSRAIRSGRWKLVAEIHQPWELYDLQVDRTETNDLAGKLPAKVKELEKQYLEWAKGVGVVDWDLIK